MRAMRRVGGAGQSVAARIRAPAQSNRGGMWRGPAHHSGGRQASRWTVSGSRSRLL